MSLTWINPIFDRTSLDVSTLKNIQDRILSVGYDNITPEEKLYWLYGEIVTEQLLASDDSIETSELELLYVIGGSGFGTPKGSLNYADLNRIENNIELTYELLVLYGNIVSIELRESEWTIYDFPILSEIDRLKQNVITLLNKINYNSVQQLGDVNINFADINLLEFEINQLYVLINNMIALFRYSGTFYSGTQFQF